jgi:hypothetical protein
VKDRLVKVVLGAGSACHKILYWVKERRISKAARENTKGKNPQMYMAPFWVGHSVTSVRDCVRRLTDWKRFLKCGMKAWIAVCVQRTVKCIHVMESGVTIAVKSENNNVLWEVLCSVMFISDEHGTLYRVQCIIYASIT